MAAVRPVITVYNVDGAKTGQVKAPGIFTAPIRSDIVATMYKHMAKNRRQAYAVKVEAGMQHSAESWGTGRAVARIPRVAGGGTGRSGQAAFGNMCRKGRMASPTKIWRRWHFKTNKNQRRYAVASCLAASAIPALVMARGHSVAQLPEIPLVVDDSLQSLTKTKAAISALKAVGAGDDLNRAVSSYKRTSGRAKLRSRIHKVKKGPLVIFNEDNGLVKAFRNLPGVDVANVNRLNLLQLAPGGHMGRFIVWTKSAVEKLNDLYGTSTSNATLKNNYHIPHAMLSSADIARVINSDEVQTKLRGIKVNKKAPQRRNPLKHFDVKVALNPYAAKLRETEKAMHAKSAEARKAKQAAARK